MTFPAQTMPTPIDIGDIFGSGFMDSVNPGALTSILWLILFLAAVGRTRQQILSYGVQFITAYFVGSFLITLGGLDLIAAYFDIHLLLRNIQLFVGAFFLFLGCVCVIDWGRYATGNDISGPWLKLPRIFFADATAADSTEAVSSPVSIWQRLVIPVLILGFFVALLGGVWPPNYVISQLQGGLYMRGERLISFLFVFVYEILYSLPIALVFAGILYVVNSSKIMRACQDLRGAAKMAMAGLLLGWGISLFYLFW